MKIKSVAWAIIILSGIIHVSCTDGNPPVQLSKVTDFTASGCKENGINTMKVATPSSLHLKAINESQIKVTHKDVVFNCCPGKLSAECAIKQDTIFIEEKSEKNDCKCICNYDLEYSISPLQQGNYVLKLPDYQPVKIKFDIHLDVTIELIKSP